MLLKLSFLFFKTILVNKKTRYRLRENISKPLSNKGLIPRIYREKSKFSNNNNTQYTVLIKIGTWYASLREDVLYRQSLRRELKTMNPYCGLPRRLVAIKNNDHIRYS
jgi:hypothetical protein